MIGKFAVLIVLVLAIGGCGVLKTARGGYSQRNVEPPEGELKGYGNHLASKFGLMSLFAETVYRRTYDFESSSRISACDDPQSEHFDFLMPWANHRGERYSWKRLYISQPTDIEPCFSGGGLYYETYVLENSQGKPLEAVIAYRGTDGLKNDMRTNFSAAIGIEPPQYATAKKKLIPLLNYLKSISSEIKIYATGHSLGGGLAQQAGYLSNDIVEVFAFNSTPITNWSSLALAKDGEIGIENHYPVIYRVNHGGEALGPVRFISTNLTSARYNRYDIDVQITKRKLASGHGIRLIACALANEILNFDKGKYPEHYYGREFIKKNLLRAQTGKTIICQDRTTLLTKN